MQRQAEGGTDRTVPIPTEDRLLLLEQQHRTANEIAAALAALHLVARARSVRGRWRLLHDAIDRFEAFGRVHVLLSAQTRSVMDLGGATEELCRALVSARHVSHSTNVTLRLPRTDVDGVTGRTLLHVCNELVTNALKHALHLRGGRLEVALSRLDDCIVLTVADDGPGMASVTRAEGGGLGGPLVAELVSRAGGSIECDTGPEGTTFHVMHPVAPRTGSPGDA